MELEMEDYVAENPTSRNGDSDSGDDSGDDGIVCKCHFCRSPLTGGIKSILVDLTKPLPMSSLDPVSILQCFGMPIHDSVHDTDIKRGSNVRVCNKCYVVITECDILYPQLHSVVSKLREVWPDKLKGIKTLSLNISFPAIEDNGNTQLVYQRKSYEKINDRKKRKNGEEIVHDDLFIPDILLSFSYIEDSDMVAEVFGELAKRSVERKVFTSKSYMCEFCDKAFNRQNDWNIHFGVVHKVIEKWQSYKLQGSLKTCINKEVQWNDKQTSTCRRKLGISPAKRRCFACAKDFAEYDAFVVHLEDFHRMSLSCIMPRKKLQTKSGLQDKAQIKCEITDEEYDDDPLCFYDSDIDTSIVKKEKSSHDAKLPQKHKLARNLVSIGHSQGRVKPNVKIIYTPHWRCRLCGELFTSQRDFEDHKRTEHSESTRARKKRKIGDGIPYSATTVCPLNVSPRKQKIRCSICNLIVNSEEALKEHHNITHERYGVVLQSDGQGGVHNRRIKLFEEETKPTLLPRIKQEPVSEPEQDGDSKESFPCNICQEEFPTHLLLIQHGCSAHDNDPSISGSKELVMIECKICQRRLHGANALRLHISRAHKEHNLRPPRKHDCKMCMWEAETKTKLYKHMKEKHDIDMMPSADCNICGKTVNAKYLERHIAIVHEKARNYPCNFCSMKFPSREYVKSHIYFEHANTKWKCEKCQLEFSKYHQLRQHRLNTHSTKIHDCSHCGKTYKRKGDLNVHFKRCHQIREPHVCHLCSKSFLERSKLRVHLMEKHGLPWESTLSKHYARHLRENNCLTRRKWKSVQPFRSKPEGDQDATYEEEDDPMQEEQYEHTVQHEISDKTSEHITHYEGSPAKIDVIEKQIEEAEFSVVEVSEDVIGEISYIILEEAPN